MSGATGSVAPRVALDAPQWAVRLCADFAQWVESLRRGPQVLTVYSKTRLPDPAKWRGGQIQVSDDVGGETPAFSDGSNWRRYADRAVIS